jgi:hypothetical protein
VLPYFCWSDPMPSVARLKVKLRTLTIAGARRVARRAGRRWSTDA